MTITFRDQIRSAILGTKHLKTETIEFFGQQIELRQPTVGDIAAGQKSQSDIHAAIDILIRYAYIPGTTDHVFEEADADALAELPFGDDVIRLTEAVNRLMSVNFQKPEAASNETDENS